MLRKISFVLLFLSMIVLSENASIDNQCRSTNHLPPFECCKKNYEEFCCPFVTKCGNHTNSLQKETNTSTSKGRPECSLPYLTNACLGGFYKGKNNTVLPCPEGFFCPSGTTCIVPCATGAVCLNLPSKESACNNSMRTISMCKLLGRSPVFLDGKWICPGAQQQRICRPGYYCPNTSIEYPCPTGYFCRLGSTRPTKCAILQYCGKGKSMTALFIEMPVRILSILGFFVVVYYSYKQRHWLQGLCRMHSSRVSLHQSNTLCDKIVFMTLMAKPILINAEEKKQQVTIRFRDVKFVLKQGKELLNGVNGVLKAGYITAIMGPSGGGKTTLLNILSNRTNYGELSGVFEVNGKTFKNMRKLKHLIGVVPQDDIMHEKLTPSEVLTYQARLRLPSNTSAKTIDEKVHMVLDILDLISVKDTIIGSEEERILSGGQRKRVNIGMELVADPSILLLDEPTSGLDSASSLAVLKALHFLAENTKLTIAAVIHQPRFEIFSMMHSIILLSANGRTIFQGKPNEIVQYFNQLGFTVPKRVNPADFIMDVVSGVTWRQQCLSTVKSQEVSPWQLTNIDENDNYAKESEEFTQGDPKIGKNSAFIDQFIAFLKREFILQGRNMNTMLLNYALTILVGSVHGAAYNELEFKKTILMATMSSLMIGLTCSIISLRCFNSYPAVLIREASSGVNIASYYLAVNAAQIPHLIALPLAYLSLNYLLIHPRTSFRVYYLVSLMTYLNVSGIAYIISIAFSRKNGQMAAVFFILLSSILSGSTPSLCDLDKIPVVGAALYNMSYARWFVEALFEKEQGFLPAVMRPTIDYFRFMNKYSLDNFTLCIWMIAVPAFVYRLIAFILLLLVARRTISVTS